MGTFYGTSVWDPWLIISQIVFLQCSFYLVVGLSMFLFSIMSGVAVSLPQLLDFRYMDVSFVQGWIPVLAFGITCVPKSVRVCC